MTLAALGQEYLREERFHLVHGSRALSCAHLAQCARAEHHAAGMCVGAPLFTLWQTLNSVSGTKSWPTSGDPPSANQAPPPKGSIHLQNSITSVQVGKGMPGHGQVCFSVSGASKVGSWPLNDFIS